MGPEQRQDDTGSLILPNNLGGVTSKDIKNLLQSATADTNLSSATDTALMKTEELTEEIFGTVATNTCFAAMRQDSEATLAGIEGLVHGFGREDVDPKTLRAALRNVFEIARATNFNAKQDSEWAPIHEKVLNLITEAAKRLGINDTNGLTSLLSEEPSKPTRGIENALATATKAESVVELAEKILEGLDPKYKSDPVVTSTILSLALAGSQEERSSCLTKIKSAKYRCDQVPGLDVAKSRIDFADFQSLDRSKKIDLVQIYGLSSGLETLGKIAFGNLHDILVCNAAVDVIVTGVESGYFDRKEAYTLLKQLYAATDNRPSTYDTYKHIAEHTSDALKRLNFFDMDGFRSARFEERTWILGSLGNGRVHGLTTETLGEILITNSGQPEIFNSALAHLVTRTVSGLFNKADALSTLKSMAIGGTSVDRAREAIKAIR